MKDTKRRKEVDAQDDTSQQVELLNARVQQLIESSASRRPIFALNRAAIPSESHASSASSAGSAYPEAFSRPGRHSLDLGVRSRYNTADTNVMNPFRVATGDEPLLSHSSQSISLRDTIPVSGFPMSSQPLHPIPSQAIAQVAALVGAGLIQPSSLVQPSGNSIQDATRLLPAFPYQRHSLGMDGLRSGLDAARRSFLLGNQPLQVDSRGGMYHPISSQAFLGPPLEALMPLIDAEEITALQALLLSSGYNMDTSRGLNLSTVIQSMQRAQPIPAVTTLASAATTLAGESLPPTTTTAPLSTSQRMSASPCSDQGRSCLLHVPSDDDVLSPYQCFVRKQIELFQATQADTRSSAQGRNRPIVVGQVGIRCIHCGALPMQRRARGAVYFPSTLMSTYQTAQNMANSHLIKDCRHIPKAVREELIRVRLRENRESKNTRKSAFGGGSSFWACGLRTYHGVVETSDKRLRFEDHTSGHV